MTAKDLQAALEKAGWTFQVRGKNGQWKRWKCGGSRRGERFLLWAWKIEEKYNAVQPEE